MRQSGAWLFRQAPVVRSCGCVPAHLCLPGPYCGMRPGKGDRLLRLGLVRADKGGCWTMIYACRDPRSFQRSAPLTGVICGPPASRASSSARSSSAWPRRPGPPVLFATRSARTSVNCLACGKARARDLTWHWSRYRWRSRPKRDSADRSRRSARLWALPSGTTDWPTIPSSSSSSTRWASRPAGPSAPVAWSASFLMTPRSRGQPRNPTLTARCQTRSKWPNACEPGGGTGQRFRPGLQLLAPADGVRRSPHRLGQLTPRRARRADRLFLRHAGGLLGPAGFAPDRRFWRPHPT